MKIRLVFIISIYLLGHCVLSGCQSAAVATTDNENNVIPRKDLPQSTPVTHPETTPTVKENINKKGLIELVKLDDSIKLDIRYATENNFVGKRIYKEARAFLQYPAAEKIAEIHRGLKKQGLGLFIFDGYRPLSPTRLFWEVTPADKKKFVANPKGGSRHNRGCAVDLGLFDLQTGKNLDMPTDFDDFTEHAAIDYPGATEQQKKNRETLRNAMEENGFKVYPAEWWHYDFQNCPESRILNVQFSEIR